VDDLKCRDRPAFAGSIVHHHDPGLKAVHEGWRARPIETVMGGEVEIHSPDWIVGAHHPPFAIPGKIAEIHGPEIPKRHDKSN
jgi:hypothetical protein